MLDVAYNDWQPYGRIRRRCNRLLPYYDVYPTVDREAMSAIILASISRLPQLRGSLRDSALRLAFHADGTGKVERAYAWLAKDRHISISTAMRHIARLITMGIIAKRVMRLTFSRCAPNIYTFLVGTPILHKRSRSSLQEVVAEQERKRSEEVQKSRQPLSVDLLKKGLQLWKPGSMQHDACLEALQRLEGSQNDSYDVSNGERHSDSPRV